MTDITKYKGKKTKKKSKDVTVRLSTEAYTKVKDIAVKCECTMSEAITNHLHLTK